MQKIVTVAIIGAGSILAIAFVYAQLTRPPYALEVDATRDTTDISGILYRIRLTNIGTEELTNIVAELGPEDIQKRESLGPGQSYYFYPEPETPEGRIIVTADEQIHVETGYRTPTKVLGLPGAGR
ncbi:MAG: hypothetical protein ACRD99_05095 [Nitrososphaera sp.]